MLWGGSRTVNQDTIDKVSESFQCDSPYDSFSFAEMHLACVDYSGQKPDVELAYSDLNQADITEESLSHESLHKERKAYSTSCYSVALILIRKIRLAETTPHWSVAANASSCVDGLISLGAGIFATNKIASTPIHMAIQGEASLKCPEIIIEYHRSKGQRWSRYDAFAHGSTL